MYMYNMYELRDLKKNFEVTGECPVCICSFLRSLSSPKKYESELRAHLFVYIANVVVGKRGPSVRCFASAHKMF